MSPHRRNGDESTGGEFRERIVCDPIALLRERKGGRDDAPAVVGGLERRFGRLETAHEPCAGQFRDRRVGEVLFEPLQVASQTRQVRLGKQFLLVFVLLGSDLSLTASVGSLSFTGSR